MLGHKVLLKKYRNHGSICEFLQKEGHGEDGRQIVAEAPFKTVLFSFFFFFPG